MRRRDFVLSTPAAVAGGLPLLRTLGRPGFLESRFTLEGRQVRVFTYAHQERDLIGVRAEGLRGLP